MNDPLRETSSQSSNGSLHKTFDFKCKHVNSASKIEILLNQELQEIDAR